MATFIHDSFGEINRVATEGDEVIIASGTKSGIYRYFDLSTFPSFSYRFLGSKQLDLGTPFEDFDSTNDSITIDFWTNRGANDDGRAFAAVLPWTDSFMDLSLDSHTITNFGSIDAKLFPAYDSGNSSITLESDWNIMQVDSALDSLNLFLPFTIEYMYNKFNTKNNRIFSINQRFNTLLSLDETGIVYNGTKYNLHVDSNLLSDSWTHNVLSYDGFEPRIYRDGNLLTSLTREDSTHFPVGVVEPGRLIDGKAVASFSIKTTIPESDKTLFFCGAEENRLIVRTIGLGTQIEISAGTNKQLSLTANVPDNINPHVISWDVNPTPGKIRLWIDSNYQGEASVATSLNNDEWAATSFAAPVMTSFTESKTMLTGGITGSTEIATKDRTDGAQFYNQGPAYFDKPAFYENADGSYRYILEYPSVVGPLPVGQIGTIFEGSYGAAGSYPGYTSARISFHRSNDDIGDFVYGYPYSANTTEAAHNQFKIPYWLPGHNADLEFGTGGGRAYGRVTDRTSGNLAVGPGGTGPKKSYVSPWWLARTYRPFVANPATGINWTENERLAMGPFDNGATEHHGFGHQGYRWRTQPNENGSSRWFTGSWLKDYRTVNTRISVPCLASYVKINSMTITPGGKKNYYFEVGEAGSARWNDSYLINKRTYKYYLVKESLIDDPNVFYENLMPAMPNRSLQWVMYSAVQRFLTTTDPHGDGIYNECVDDIDVSKYYTTLAMKGHMEFIISEQDSHFHIFSNGTWIASYPFPSGDGPYKLIISSRGDDADEAAGRYAPWIVNEIYNSDIEHGSRGNTYNANSQRQVEFDYQGVGQSAGGAYSGYTLYQGILKFSKKSWLWDAENAYKNVPDEYKGVISADTGPKTGALGIDSDGSTWTGTLHSNLLYNKQLFINYSDAELFVGNNIKSVKSLPHETGTQHAIDYVANTGGTIYNWNNPDGAGISLQQQMSQINDGDAIVIAPGTYTVNNDHGTANMSRAYGFHQRKNILITGSTNDPTDVILNVAYFAELFSGRAAADGASPSGALKELAYLTFKNDPWALIYAPEAISGGRAYRVNFELRSNTYHVYQARRNSNIIFEECLISNRSTPSNSIWGKYDARCIKWINCIFEKTGGQDPALQTDLRQANIFIGNNIMQVGDDIAYNKNKLRLGIPYFKVDTENPNTPVNKKRYIEDFMIHKTDKYDSISVPFPVNRAPFTDSNTKLHIASNMSGGEQLAYNIDGTLIINNRKIKLNDAANGLGDWHHHSFNYRGSDNVLFSYFDGNKIDSMNIELDIEELSKSNLLLASTDDYDIASHSIVKSFSNLYIKEMRVSRKMRESGDVFTLPVADLTTDGHTVILDATVSGNPLSTDVSPYTADAKAYRKVHSFNPGIESAAFEPLVTIGSGTNAPAKNEEPLNFTLRDGYRPVPHYVFKYESDGLLSNPTGYTSIVESDGSYIGDLTGFIHDSLVTPDSDLAFDRSSHIIKLKRFDDLGDSINWSYTKSIPRNNIQLGKYDDSNNSIFYVKAYDISESNLHWNTDLNFVGKHVDSASRVPNIESGTRLNDSTSGDIEVIFEYNGDMGVGVTYMADIQYIRIFDLDSAEAIGFDSSQVTFDPFQSSGGYL